MPQCRSCQAEVVWMKSTRGKNIPVDPKTVGRHDKIFNPKIHRAHWADCPHAEQWKRDPYGAKTK